MRNSISRVRDEFAQRVFPRFVADLLLIRGPSGATLSLPRVIKLLAKV